MKLWKISLWLSITSCVILLIIFILPDNFTVFSYTKSEVGAGVLFPVLLLSWTFALFGFAVNNVYIDKTILDKNAKRMPGLKTYLPTLLGLPAFISFLWFIIRWYKGKPGGI
jgi:uncharacterized membrane protein